MVTGQLLKYTYTTLGKRLSLSHQYEEGILRPGEVIMPGRPLPIFLYLILVHIKEERKERKWLVKII